MQEEEPVTPPRQTIRGFLLGLTCAVLLGAVTGILCVTVTTASWPLAILAGLGLLACALFGGLLLRRVAGAR